MWQNKWTDLQAETDPDCCSAVWVPCSFAREAKYTPEKQVAVWITSQRHAYIHNKNDYIQFVRSKIDAHHLNKLANHQLNLSNWYSLIMESSERRTMGTFTLYLTIKNVFLQTMAFWQFFQEFSLSLNSPIYSYISSCQETDRS